MLKKIKLRHKIAPNRRDYFNLHCRDSYSTHQEALITYALITNKLFPGSMIVELGCGHYSTPLLNAIAQSQDRPYKIFYEIEDWAEKFHTRFDYPEFEKLVNWKNLELPENTGIVLVDQEGTVRERCTHLQKESFINAKVVVLHDADSPGAGVLKIQKNFKSKKLWGGDTLVLSNFMDVEV